MPIANSLKNSIKNIICKFKFEELENAVLPVFPETSWDYVRSQLMMHHHNFTTLNAAAIIEEVINDNELEVTQLSERLMKLELHDISRHQHRVWYSYNISGCSDKPFRFGTEEFKEKIKQKLTTLSRKKIEVATLMFNGIMYINIKYIQLDNMKTIPNYFALLLGQEYIFSTKKNAPKIFVDVITHNMGYSKNKIYDLSGKDLMSLINLLRRKIQGVLDPVNIKTSPTYRDAEPIIKSTGIDYSQEKQRKNFAEKCFGKSPPKLDRLVVKGPNCTINDRDIAAKLPDNIKIGWEFRSHNIATFLTTLAEKGVLLPPLPPYISNLMSIGKNSLTLENE